MGREENSPVPQAYQNQLMSMRFCIVNACEVCQSLWMAIRLCANEFAANA